MALRVNVATFDPNAVQYKDPTYPELVDYGTFLRHHTLGELWFYAGNYYTCKVDNGMERVYRLSEDLARSL